MRLKKSFLCGMAGASLLGSITMSTLAGSDASAGPLPASPSSAAPSHGMRHGGMAGHVMTGPTGNKVEMVDPARSRYVPKIAAASARDRAKAQRLLDGVNTFCRTHSASTLKTRWTPGSSSPSHPTHYYNPHSGSLGLHPRRPRAALIYQGRLGGVMFTGMPLPRLGSIPRAHSHDMSMSVEMVHVYCTRSLKKAFTPNRMLGVMAQVRMLRLRIRPAVMDLNRAQLRAVRHRVRAYAGNKLRAVPPVGTSANGGPDPVLRAMRTEIRRSLMILSHAQLRHVWLLMSSY